MELDELKKKAAYIKGLLDGFGIDESTNEGKVLHAMSELLGEMADAICDLDADVGTLCDEVDVIGQDLYGEEPDDDTEDGEDSDDEPSDADLENEPYYEVACPNCGETVYVSEGDLDAGEAVCPACKAVFEVALADEDEEGDADDGPVQYEVTCSACGATFVLDEDALLGGDPTCPNCGKPLELGLKKEEE